MGNAITRPARRVWELDGSIDPAAAATYRNGMAGLFRVELHDPDPQNFRNRVESYNLGRGVLARCRSVAQTFIRDEAAIRSSDIDHLQIILDLAGLSVCDYAGRRFRADAGGVRLVDMRRPFQVEAQPFETLNFVAPRAALPQPWTVREVHGLRLSAEQPLGRLLAAHLSATWAMCPDLSMPEADAASRAVLALAAGVPGALDARARRPVEATLVSLAEAFVDAHLAESSLNPDGLRAHLGVSRRTLYRILEDQGGVRTFIQGRRLDHALRAVAESDPRSNVSDIALAHGFVSDAHFSRAFRARFGIRPGELKAARGRSRAALPAGADQPLADILAWIRAL